MPLISDKDIRLQIAAVLRVVKKEFPHNSDELSLKQLDEMSSVLVKARNEANNQTASYFKRELSVAYLTILGLTVTCFAISPTNDKRPPIPRDWVSKSGEPDPNLILQNLLLQVINYALAVVRLVQDGLDNPARCVLRALNELSCQFLVLSAERSKLETYAGIKTPAEAKQVWYELFAKKGRLGKSLTSLESRVGLSDTLVSELRSYRDNTNTLHSEAVHHSFASTIIGAYAGDFEDEESLHFALFGKATPASSGTLDNLNTILMYTLLMFMRILVDIHGYEASMEDKDWREVFLFAQAITKVNSAE